MSSTTRASLLFRLRHCSDLRAWQEFDTRYGPLVVGYCRACGLQQADAEDIRQMVMSSLARRMERFEYDPRRGRFRDYLRTVTRHAISHWAKRPTTPGRTLSVEGVADLLDSTAMDSRWQEEWMQFHFRVAIEKVQSTHDAVSLAIFDRLLAGMSVAQVAEEFATSTQAVHKVKQRLRDRLKELVAEQIRQENVRDG